MLNTKKNLESAEQYWGKILENEKFIPTNLLVCQPPKSSSSLKESENAHIHIDQEMVEQLYSRCSGNESLLYAYLLSMWSVLLSQYTRSKQVVIGVPNLKDNQKNPQANLTLPFFLEMKADITFKNILRDTKNSLDNLYSHPLIPLSLINMNIGEFHHIVIGFESLHGLNYVGEMSGSNFVINMSHTSSGIHVTAHNQLQLNEDFVNSLLKHYIQLLRNSLDYAIDTKLQEFSTLSIDEYLMITDAFNERKVVEVPESPLHIHFQKSVRSFSKRQAIKDLNETLSYEELNDRSDYIARGLLNKGLKTGEVVAFICERSVNTIAGLLGILKAGGVFLPIDPSLPSERVNYMLKDSQAQILLISSRFALEVDSLLQNILIIEDVVSLNDKQDIDYPLVSKDHAACIIYTSGTTGHPKGVLFNHNILLHHTSAFSKYVASGEKPRNIGLIAPYYFDVFLEDVFYGLFNGHTIFIIQEDAQLDAKLLMEVLCDHQIHYMNATPTQIRILLSNSRNEFSNSSIELFLIGGEPLKETLINDIKVAFAHAIPQIINCYGPTECCVDVTTYRVDSEQHFYPYSIPIGKPMKNVGAYITGLNNEVLPIGVIGELCFSGDVLTKGYIGKPDESSKVFSPSPFIPGETFYRTGDLAMWLPDGNIEFVKRIDSQIKVRGHRVELSEIEIALQQHKHVKEAIVLFENEELEAFVVMDSEGDLKELKRFLREKLPSYMQPSKFALLEVLPTNANGKIDKKALKHYNGFASLDNSHSGEMNTETEKVLSKIWIEILNVNVIDREDNFFDLGGHSLKAAVLTAEIYSAFQKNISIKQLFSSPELYRLAELIDLTDNTTNIQISPAPAAAFYPLSLAQERLFTLHSLNPESTAYNMPGLIEVKGHLDKNRLEYTLGELIKRHEILRTVFEIHDHIPMQRIVDDINLKLEWRKLQYDQVQAFKTEFAKPFDLGVAPLFRVCVVECTEDLFYVLFDVHHIIADGQSFEILTKEIFNIYNGAQLEESVIQYKDYAYWEKEFTKTLSFGKMKDFWIDYMSSEIPELNLPIDFERERSQTFNGSTIYKEVRRKTVDHLKKISKKCETTMFMNLLTAYYVFLNKYTGNQDFVVGTTASTRNDKDLSTVMGPLINALAIRQDVNPEITFLELLSRVKSNVLNVYENKNYPFNQLVENIQNNRDKSRNPLFDTMLIMHQYEENLVNKLEGLSVRSLPMENPIAKMDLSLEFSELDGKIIVCFEYNTDLFLENTVERLANHFINLLDMISESPDERLESYTVLSDEEMNWQIYELNNNETELSFNQPVHSLIREKAVLYPDQIAIREGNKVLTYRQLIQRADIISQDLILNGIGKGKIVALMMERSASFVASVLGVIQTGAAYVPIDPMYPQERVEYILDDSNCFAVITDKQYEQLRSKSIYNMNVESVFLDNVMSDLHGAASLPEISIADPAYVIYTSGSTGKPKGVVISHKSLLNYSTWAAKVYVGDEQLTFPLYTSIAFDLTVTSIFTPLITGNCIVVYSDPPEKSLERIIEDNLVDIIKLTPSHLRLLKEMNLDHSRIRRFIVGGEALETHVARKLEEKYRNTKIEIFNEYGPTEATVGCMIYQLDSLYEGPFVPIGIPAENMKIYVLDKSMNPCPPSVIGELYISGVGVGIGYLGKTELTRDRFIQNPFVIDELMYKTGDLAKLLPDGNFMYMGRLDDQVKVRGHRIELGEVEYHLNQNIYIKESAAFVELDAIGGFELKACVVLEDSDDSRFMKKITEELRTRLPLYMVPDRVFVVEEIPYTMNGKVDKKSIVEIIEANSHVIDTPLVKEDTTLTDPVESEISDMWVQLLGIPSINVKDDFFELGGHSLKAIMFLSRLKKKFEVEISLESFFANSTVEKLSDLIGKQKKWMIPELKPAEIRDYYPLTSAQMRLYFLQQLNNGTAYNIVEGFIIKGVLDKERFKNAINYMIERHEILRTSFELLEEAGVVQVVHDPNQVQPILKWHKSDQDTLDSSHVFDLSKAPLFSSQVIETDQHQFMVKFEFHHIIFDGISIQPFIQDFVDLYNEVKVLKPLEIQYKDYALWQQEYMQTEPYEQQEKYWLERLSGDLPVLALPTDFSRPLVKSFNGQLLRFEANPKLSSRFLKLCQDTGITLYMGLIGLFGMTLYRYTQQNDILIGTPVAGRQQEELEDLIGMFVNTMVLRMKPVGTTSFRDLALEIKNDVIKMLEYQDVPFEQLVEKLNIERDTSRNPIFDVMFALQNYDEARVETEDHVEILPYNVKSENSKFDLTLFAWEENEHISFALEYSTELFEMQTMDRLSKHLLNLMSEITAYPDRSIGTLNMLNEDELKQIKTEFNSKSDEIEPKPLHYWFEQQVAKTPEAISVIHGENKISYLELDRRANALAHALDSKGSVRGSIVGVMMDRSPEMIIGILGILKSGAAYLPLDPEYPVHRLQYMLADSKVSILIVDNKTVDLEIPGFNGERLNVQSIDYNEPLNKFTCNVEINSLAYIIYTSGSTGNPKGVKITHSAIFNTIHWRINYYSFGLGDNTLQLPSLSFDSSVEDIFSALLAGGTLTLISSKERLDTKALSRIIEEQKITHFLIVPSLYAAILATKPNFASLKSVTVAGEEMHVQLAQDHFNLLPNVRLINEYGPSECSVCTTAYEVKADDREVCIGKPINNMEVYILDNNGSILPIGVPGELYIAGKGLSQGYLNNDENTRLRFVDVPNITNKIFYRSGDLGRWRSDGTIEYLGRIDNQVKIRGHRVELEEIERCVLNLRNTVQASVVKKRVNDMDRLMLYVVIEANESINEQQLRSELAKVLPGFMLPDYIVFLSELPLTSNGKVDRLKLTLLEDTERVNDRTLEKEELNEIEWALLEEWKKVIGQVHISKYDNFFEVGGNSLLLIQLHANLNKKYSGKLSITDYFSYPTISDLAHYLESDNNVEGYSESRQSKMRFGESHLDTTLSGGAVFKLSLDYDRSSEFKKVAKSMRSKSQDVAISILIYTLNQYTKLDNILIDLAVSEKTYMSLDVNMTNFEDLEQLVFHITEQQSQLEVFNHTPLLPYLDGEINILFNRHSTSSLASKYDIVLQYQESENDVLIQVIGSPRIREQTIKEITELYVTILFAMCDQFTATSF
ncbi:non-ribosomal peptide synthetase [Paenibacillus polysaccharolyticus]|uniref:non-ribosomal peptide synthetase n=1 Tax=Paenibacillus polysaccharolyticus TaxID=582692 RepID=UPI00280A5CB0|nr:non-ribosomal peptide synthetase [Paenibacillus polysaccharolyticus]